VPVLGAPVKGKLCAIVSPLAMEATIITSIFGAFLPPSTRFLDFCVVLVFYVGHKSYALWMAFWTRHVGYSYKHKPQQILPYSDYAGVQEDLFSHNPVQVMGTPEFHKRAPEERNCSNDLMEKPG
jgi:hypothetical protein